MKKYITILLVFIFTFLLAVPSFAANIDINSEVAQTKLYYRENFKNELFDWQQTIIFAATNILTNDIKLAIPELTETNKEDASTYAKIILTYAAIGRDPRTYSENIDYVDTLVSMQKEDGSFGDIYTTAFSIYALEAARAEYQSQKAIDFILSKKFTDGGYAYEGAIESDIDTTAMILTVFSKFKLDSKVNNSIKEIITFLKSKQQENGGFIVWGNDNSNTLASVIMGLWDVGENIESEEWNHMLTSLLRFKNPDGSYRYTEDSPKEADDYSTLQCFMALEAYRYGASMYKTLANNGTFNAGINWEGLKPLIIVFAILAIISVLFWMYILFIRNPKVRTLEESKTDSVKK